VRTVPRSGTLDRRVKAEALGGLTKRSDVRLPVSLVEVHGKQPTGLVFEERIDTNDMSALEMIEKHLWGDRDEGLMGTVPALDSRLLADPRNPLVRTDRGVAARLLSGIVPMPREDVGSAAEQSAKELDFLGTRPRSM